MSVWPYFTRTSLGECLAILYQNGLVKGRARYRSINDRARYWLFFGDEVWEVELGKFSVKKKKKRILSGLEPMLIPLTGQCNYH